MERLEIILRNQEARRILETPINRLPEVYRVDYSHMAPLIDRMYKTLWKEGFKIPRSTYFSDEWGVNENSITLGLDPMTINEHTWFFNDCIIGAKYLPKGAFELGFGNGRYINMPFYWNAVNALSRTHFRHEMNELIIAAYDLEKDPRLSVFGDFTGKKKDAHNRPFYPLFQWPGGMFYYNYEDTDAHERLASALTAFNFGYCTNLVQSHRKALSSVLADCKNSPPKITTRRYINRMRHIGHTVAEYYKSLGISEKMKEVSPYTSISYFVPVKRA
jgi:hypothetical protein